jgi:hypothetical protein
MVRKRSACSCICEHAKVDVDAVLADSLVHLVRGPWPIDVEVVGAACGGTVLWRHAGRTTLTIIVKASFALDEGTARLLAPADLVVEERFLPHSRSLLADVDIAPYKPRAEVTFVGSAFPPSPVPQTMTRLAIQGSSPLFDRPLRVLGDRQAPGAAPAPFRSMPLSWDRAWAEPMSNPVGVQPNQGRAPNVIDPTNENAPASYGPISRSWGARARFVGRGDPRMTLGTRPEMPAELSWGLFLAAPVDQQVSRLQGDEVLVLENLIEGAPRVRSQLPGARANARYFGPNAPRDGAAVAMRLDTLAINGYERVVHVLWRGTMAFPNEAAASASRVVAGIEMPNQAGAFAAPPAHATQQAPRQAPQQGSPATVRMTTRGLGPAPAPPPPAPPPPPPVFQKDSSTMPVGRPMISVPKVGNDPPLYDLDDDPESTAGSTMAIDPEAAMRMLAGKAATPWEAPPPPAPPPPAPPPPAPPPPAQPPPPAPATGHVVVRPAGSHDLEDDDSVGSTMAISPEAAAALIARRGPATEPAPAPPLQRTPSPTGPPTSQRPRTKAPDLPPPPPPPPMPPAMVPHAPGHPGAPPGPPPPAPPPPVGRSPAISPDGRHGTIEMEPVPDSAPGGGGTMVLQVPDDIARRSRGR